MSGHVLTNLEISPNNCLRRAGTRSARLNLAVTEDVREAFLELVDEDPDKPTLTEVLEDALLRYLESRGWELIYSDLPEVWTAKRA